MIIPWYTEGMKIIVGLGNPGSEHENNRHNVGFMVIDRLAMEKDAWESKFGALILRSGDQMLVKPQSFMNNSGEAVSKVVNFYKVLTADLWVIHDDLDLPLGQYKIAAGIGPKVHNGVNSIEERLGTKDFWRVRVGVDNRPVGEARTPGDEYVLADFSADERIVIDGVIEKVIKELWPK